jgi:hypothetical protein
MSFVPVELPMRRKCACPKTGPTRRTGQAGVAAGVSTYRLGYSEGVRPIRSMAWKRMGALTRRLT